MSAQLDMIDYLARYPDGPGYVPHSATSRAAAIEIGPKINELQHRVFKFIESCGTSGATDEEIIDATGLNPSTGRPRRVELVCKNLVEDSGISRPTKSGRSATVWRVK